MGQEQLPLPWLQEPLEGKSSPCAESWHRSECCFSPEGFVSCSHWETMASSFDPGKSRLAVWACL